MLEIPLKARNTFVMAGKEQKAYSIDCCELDICDRACVQTHRMFVMIVIVFVVPRRGSAQTFMRYSRPARTLADCQVAFVLPFKEFQGRDFQCRAIIRLARRKHAQVLMHLISPVFPSEHSPRAILNDAGRVRSAHVKMGATYNIVPADRVKCLYHSRAIARNGLDLKKSTVVPCERIAKGP